MLRPYVKPQPRLPVALVGEDLKALTETGKRWKLGSVEPSTVLYATRRDAMRSILSGNGYAVCWNGSPTRWEYRGRKIIILADPYTDPDYLMAGMVTWRDWLGDRGARVGTLTSSSVSLLQTTLNRPLWVGMGSLPPLTEVIGGRIQPGCAPGFHRNVELWDIASAYPTFMGSLPYDGHWSRWEGDCTDTDLPVIQHAIVRIPPMRYGPLPRRLRKRLPTAVARRFFDRTYPTSTRMQGLWSRSELELARLLGCDVSVDTTWVCIGHRYPFAGWLEAITEGKELEGYAGKLAKYSGNMLWGTFAAQGSRSILRYDGGHMQREPFPLTGSPPHDYALAEVITAGVRTRLYLEAIDMDPYSLHTDGGIFPAGKGPRAPGWRHKGSARHLVYLTPQMYAYGDLSQLRYVVSGTPPAQAAEVFWDSVHYCLNMPKLADPTTRHYLQNLLETFPELAPRIMSGGGWEPRPTDEEETA